MHQHQRQQGQQWKAQHRQQVRQYQQQRQQQRQQRRLRQQQARTQLQLKSQPPQKRVDTATKITFGVTANERHRAIGWITLIAGVIGAAINISGDQDYWWLFWVLFWLILLPISVFCLCGRNELILDFANNRYMIQTGYYPSIETLQGPLSEITAIQIDRERVKDGFVFRTRFVFREDLHHPPFRIDALPSSVSVFESGDAMFFVLALAKRLNIPVYDEAGWGYPQSLYKEPQRIVIQPGETHPALKSKTNLWIPE